MLARIDWSWLRFAPFSLSRLAVVAGAIGVLSQFGDDLPFLNRDNLEHTLGVGGPLRARPGRRGRRWSPAWSIWVLISVTGYVVQWWSFLLVRERGHLRLTAGLFTTRSTTVEDARIRGVALTEPVLLRAGRRRRARRPSPPASARAA